MPYYEGGELKTTGCGSSGPAERITISLSSGVEITVQSSSTDLSKNSSKGSSKESRNELSEKYTNFYLYANITAPDSVEFSFVSNEVIISDNLTSRQWVLTITELYTSPDNVSSQHELGMYFKHSNLLVPATTTIIGKSYIHETWFKDRKYNFGASISISTKEVDTYLTDFSVSFPSLIINGISSDLKPIRFKHVKYIGITPLNC
ncbi:hypothetical protein [Shewanella donghaensis]|uniref:hypothetical protein n=1 Tax=Shewanella donghaensis TaxID=238836 RepID=UPI0011837C52|nr:hypothetical protein [Shewanella donghaensis]